MKKVTKTAKKPVKKIGLNFNDMNWANVEKFMKKKDFLNHYPQLILNSVQKDFYFTVIPVDGQIIVNFAPVKHYKKHKRPITTPFYIRHILPQYCKFVEGAPPGIYEISVNLLEGVENISEDLRNQGFIDDKKVSSNFKNLYAEDMEMTDFIANLIIKHKKNDTLHKYVVHRGKPSDIYLSKKDNYIYCVPKEIYDNFSKKQLRGLDCHILAKYKAHDTDAVTGYGGPELSNATEEQKDEALGLERTFPKEYDHCLSYLGDSVYVVHSNMDEIVQGLEKSGYEFKDIEFNVAKKWAKKEAAAKEIFANYVPYEEPKGHGCGDDNCTGCDTNNDTKNVTEEPEENVVKGPYDDGLTFENFPVDDFSGIGRYHIMGLFSNSKQSDFYAHATAVNEGDKSLVFLAPKGYWDKHKKMFPYELLVTNLLPLEAKSNGKNAWLLEHSEFVNNKILKMLKFDTSNEEFNQFIEDATLETLYDIKEIASIFSKESV